MHTRNISFGGRTLTIETGRLAKQADGSVIVRSGDTMVLVTALAPLHRAAGIERMVVSTYQSVSGAGQPGMHELDEQLGEEP